MWRVSVHILIGLAVVLLGYTRAEVGTSQQATETAIEFHETEPVLNNDEAPAPAKALEKTEEASRGADQQQYPRINRQEPPQQQQQEQHEPQEEEKHNGQQLLLGALRFDTLFQYMTDMQKRFLLAVLPDSWAVPKFLPSANSVLQQMLQFLRDISESMGAQSIPAAVVNLAESGDLPSLLHRHPDLPPVLKDLLATSTTNWTNLQQGLQNSLQELLPNLDAGDLEELAKLFRVPSELEFPVSPEGLSLFIPVVVRNISSFREPLPGEVEQGLKELQVRVPDILVPVVDQGVLLFSDAASVLQGIQFPQELPIHPLALFSALEVEPKCQTPKTL